MSANAHEYNTDTVNRDHVKIMKRLLWFFCKLCKRLFLCMLWKPRARCIHGIRHQLDWDISSA